MESPTARASISWAEFVRSVRYGKVDVFFNAIPRFGDSGVGLFIDGSTLRALDGKSGKLLWARTATELGETPVVPFGKAPRSR